MVISYWSFLFQLRGPVRQDRDRREVLRQAGDDEKPLAVVRHAVTVGETQDPRLEKRLNDPDVESGAVGFHSRRHEPVVRGEVEELLAVATPARLDAAVLRDRPSVARARKRRDIDFESSRLVRLIRDVPSVRRELPDPLERGRRQKRPGLPVSGQGKDPEVIPVLLSLRIEKEVPVRRKTERGLEFLRVGYEHDLGLGTIDRLQDDVVTGSPGVGDAVRDPDSVGRPYAPLLAARPGREPPSRPGCQ